MVANLETVDVAIGWRSPSIADLDRDGAKLRTGDDEASVTCGRGRGGSNAAAPRRSSKASCRGHSDKRRGNTLGCDKNARVPS